MKKCNHIRNIMYIIKSMKTEEKKLVSKYKIIWPFFPKWDFDIFYKDTFLGVTVKGKAG